MKLNRGSLAVGALLVVLGVLFLLQNFGILGDLQDLVWLVIFGVAGLVFLYVFLSNREQWWAVIPGFALLGLAAMIGLADRLGVWGAVIFFAAIGLSFWVIYAIRREFWWAVIPGGALFTLAAVAGLSEALQGDDGMVIGGVFFIGLGLTFLLIYLLPTPQGRMKWALIPGGILGVMGLLLLLSLGGIINYLIAALLIIVGGYLVVRAALRRQ